MGAKGELCKEHRFWHGELASRKDIAISEMSGCLNVYVEVPQSTFPHRSPCEHWDHQEILLISVRYRLLNTMTSYLIQIK